MKKIFSFIIMISLTLIFSVTSFAAINESDVVNLINNDSSGLGNYNEELAEFKSFIEEGERYEAVDSGGAAPASYLIDSYGDISQAHRIYSAEPLIITEYRESKNADSLFSGRYVWAIPVNGDKNEPATFILEDGKFKFASLSSAPVGYYISNSELVKSISESNIDVSKIKEIRHLYSGLYHAAFALIYTDSTVYCVPVAAREEFWNLENGKVYELEDMMNRLYEHFDEDALKENPNSNGGVPLRETNKIWIPIVILSSAAIAVISAVYIILTRKKRKA
ncbi:MAG: hypothetical protein K2G60_00630 [Oscillospiraceae bacterium]|nr:hypothetical protein [Oscillospiraceae bacterium]